MCFLIIYPFRALRLVVLVKGVACPFPSIWDGVALFGRFMCQYNSLLSLSRDLHVSYLPGCKRPFFSIFFRFYFPWTSFVLWPDLSSSQVDEIMNTEQMELKLARSPKLRPMNRRRNLSRASWWFTQMRNAVNETRGWSESTHGMMENPSLATGSHKH